MFIDRFDAGEKLAKVLSKYKNKKDTIILAIPRGALQMGEVLHKELNLPFDIIITKKLAHPMQSEYAIGAVGPDGEYFVDQAASAGVSDEYIGNERKRLEIAIEEKYKLYRGELKKPELKNKTVIITDDGIATGSTIIAAIHVIRKQKPKKIIVAVPVAPPDVITNIKEVADEVICLQIPESFFAIGAFYEKFPQVEDGEAVEILKRCREK